MFLVQFQLFLESCEFGSFGSLWVPLGTPLEPPEGHLWSHKALSIRPLFWTTYASHQLYTSVASIAGLTLVWSDCTLDLALPRALALALALALGRCLEKCVMVEICVWMDLPATQRLSRNAVAPGWPLTACRMLNFRASMATSLLTLPLCLYIFVVMYVA